MQTYNILINPVSPTTGLFLLSSFFFLSQLNQLNKTIKIINKLLVYNNLQISKIDF